MPTWETANDWDNVASDSGVVHEDVPDTDHTNAGSVKRGYSSRETLFSADCELYYPMHEDSGSTAYDKSGNNRDGTYNNTTLGAAGLFDTSAPQMDGDDYIDVTGLLDQPGSFTRTIWTYPTAGGDIDPWTQDDGFSPRNYLHFDRNGNNAFEWDMEDGSGSFQDVVSSSVSLDTWHHVALRYDATNDVMEMYVDGSWQGTTAIVGTQAGGGNAHRLGDHPNGGHSWQGKLAEARAYNRALSTSEIQQIYDVYATPGNMTTDWRSL